MYDAVYRSLTLVLFFFFTAPATTEIYTLSLHDALPISPAQVAIAALEQVSREFQVDSDRVYLTGLSMGGNGVWYLARSEEHTSELQSRGHLVCRLLLEKKKQ